MVLVVRFCFLLNGIVNGKVVLVVFDDVDVEVVFCCLDFMVVEGLWCEIVEIWCIGIVFDCNEYILGIFVVVIV